MLSFRRIRRRTKQVALCAVRVGREKAYDWHYYFAHKKGHHPSRFATGGHDACQKYGKGFEKFFKELTLHAGPKTRREYFVRYGLNIFESETALQLYLNGGWPYPLAHVAIGFQKNTLIIEAMQTTKKHRRKNLNEFRRVAKELPLDFLLKQAEQTAKKAGLKEVRIRRPETLYYYAKPARHDGLTLEQLQRNMRILYGRIARANGYKKELFFYTKRIA